MIVDGQPVVVRGDRAPTPADLEAIAEVARAARDVMARDTRCLARPARPALPVPCLEQAGHAGKHRDAKGREW